MTDRTLIKNLAAASDGPVSVSGWVDTVRDQKKVQFIVLRDESGALQLVHPRTDVEEGSAARPDRRRDLGASRPAPSSPSPASSSTTSASSSAASR